jgi:protein arginine kinase
MAHPFPARLTRAAAIPFMAGLDRFFRAGAAPDGQGGAAFPALAECPLDEAPPVERLFRAADGGLDCLVNRGDHFRLGARGAGLGWRPGLGAGLGWRPGLAGLHALEAALERVFPFAVDLSWGHLSASLACLGTGLRATVLLHLPALAAGPGPAGLTVLAEDLEAARGLELRPCPPPGCPGAAGGACFELSNRETLGPSEDEILDQLAQTAGLLLHYERMAAVRERAGDPGFFDDRAWREWGALRHCRRLDPPGIWSSLGRLRPALLAGGFGSAGAGGPEAWRLNLLAALAAGAVPGGDPAVLADRARQVCGNPD